MLKFIGFTLIYAVFSSFMLASCVHSIEKQVTIDEGRYRSWIIQACNNGDPDMCEAIANFK